MKNSGGNKDLRQIVRNITIGMVIVFALIVVVSVFQKRPVPKAKPEQPQQQIAEVKEQQAGAESPSLKGQSPTYGDTRKGPTYPAPSYPTPGGRAPSTYGQMQKLEPTVPGSSEKPSMTQPFQRKEIQPSEPPMKPGEREEALPVPKPAPSIEIAHERKKVKEVELPEISPIAGVTFVETMISLMEKELKGRFLGWRPNDLIIGRFTDNINNYQLGVLEAMRFTTLRLKDSLTRMGEADAYDRDLQDALNLFMNKATQFWFPSAETSYTEAVEHLKRFLEKLKRGERRFYYRIDNLISLIVSYNDLLGNVNRTLIMKDVSFFESDDYFYYAKGVAHVMFEILKVVRVGFREQLATINATEIMDEILEELQRAEEMDPWIILNGNLDGIFANHRANLNAPLSEVAHLMTVMSRF